MIPKHIAIIMDGNGRWAKKRYMPRVIGHQKGANKIKTLMKHAKKIGVKYLSIYAFSTENWKRPQIEIDTLMELFQNYLQTESKNIIRDNIKLLVTGRKEKITSTLLRKIAEVEKLTMNNTGITLNICFNYGGRAEIIDAVKKITKLQPKDVTEESFKDYLYSNLPYPELLIRTGGEYRVSNFMLWQIAYSELYITDVLWPDFDEKELDIAIDHYNKRERKFGGLTDDQ